MIEGQEGVSWAHWVALAQACEENGIGALFRSDHYLAIDSERELGSLDAWGTVCALAAVTSTVRLGTLVSPATFRHPSNLAKLAATADEISDGRIEVGLGAGWYEPEHRAYGFPFAPLRERMDVLEEQLQIVIGSWTQTPFSFSGAHYRIEELDAQPKPRQVPHPPLIMGGSAAPRSAALAARYADEYNTPFPPLAEVVRRRAAIDAACERIEREPIPFSVMTCVIVGADERELGDRAARVAELHCSPPADILSSPPPGWIVGTVEQVAEQFEALRDAGVSRLMCQHLAYDDLDMVALLGRELAPALAGD